MVSKNETLFCSCLRQIFIVNQSGLKAALTYKAFTVDGKDNAIRVDSIDLLSYLEVGHGR